jgi:hypothetical protein
MMSTVWPNIRRWLVSKQRTNRRTMIVLAVLVLLGLGHVLILRLLAWPLTADGSSVECDCFCIHGGELGADGFEPYDAAAAWHGKTAGRRILLLLPRTTRIVEIGAVRSFEQTCLCELSKRGVPPADVGPIRADARDTWDEAYALDNWLKAHPNTRVWMACSPFNSGRLRYVLDKVLGPADAARVGLIWLPDPGSGVDNWWRSRRGVKDFMYAWLELIYAWTGGDRARPLPVGAAAFQQEIRAQIGEAPP